MSRLEIRFMDFQSVFAEFYNEVQKDMFINIIYNYKNMWYYVSVKDYKQTVFATI